jgi:hypothetical protein
MKRIVKCIGFVLILLHSFNVVASELWQPLSISQRGSSDLNQSGQYYQVDQLRLIQQLSRAGTEGPNQLDTRIELPITDDQIEQFQIIEYSMMAPALAAKFPDIKTYKIKGIDDPNASGRLSMTPQGFNAMIVSRKGTYFMDQIRDGLHHGYSKKSSSDLVPFKCGVVGHDHKHPVSVTANRLAQRTTGSIQVYRLALAADSAYVTRVGGTVGSAMAEMTNTINRVNEIYERDLGIRLELVGNNDQLIYPDAATDPYSNGDINTMLEENQANLDAVIGNGNYDIGHVFGTGGGGLASVGSVCQKDFKAQGATALKGVSGESFYIDYVAHEMGHQFGAEHTFNGTTLNCSGNRSATSAVEPGSGATIMAYAGICNEENLQSQTDAHFHAKSISDIDSYTSSAVGSCSTTVTASNPNQPVADAGNNYTIPSGTPFFLTAAGSDADGDILSYNWYQMDIGASTNAQSFGEDLGTNPLFRSYLPRSEKVRHFPALGTTLENVYDYAEVLACNSRDINFRLAVRDGNGGVSYDDTVITVNGSSGPFSVTAFNSAQAVSPGSYTVTWDVAKTDQSPINCSSVNISLLTFNSTVTTYKETMLAPGEPNDGSAEIIIPDLLASKARIKVQCQNNIFYDISDEYISLSGSGVADTTGNTVFDNIDGDSLRLTPASTSCVYVSAPTDPVSNSDSGGGFIGLYGLISLFSILVTRRSLKLIPVKSS